MLGDKLLNIQFAKYHIWNNKSEGFPNMVLSTETFNQTVRTEYSEAVNARYTFQPLWVSVGTNHVFFTARHAKTASSLSSEKFSITTLFKLLTTYISVFKYSTRWKRF